MTNSFKALIHCTVLWPVSAACQQDMGILWTQKQINSFDFMVYGKHGFTEFVLRTTKNTVSVCRE